MSALIFDTDKRRSAFPIAEMTKAEKRQSQILIATVLTEAPWFSYLLLSVLKFLHTTAIPVAATDELSVFVNPEVFYTKYTLRQQVFIVCHEVLHVVFFHCSMGSMWLKQGYVQLVTGERLDYIPELGNIAADYVINGGLVASKIGEMPPEALYDPSISKAGMEAMVSVYEMLYRRWVKPPPPQGRGRPCKDGPPGPSNKNNPPQKAEANIPQNVLGKLIKDMLEPGSGSGKDVTPSEGKVDGDQRGKNMAIAVAAATSAAKSIGMMPQALERIVGELLTPKVSWQDHIKATLARRTGPDGYDWALPDRRLISRDQPIYFARQSSYGCGHVAVAVDTSGSISKDEINRFLSEIAGIIEDMNPAGVSVIFCDAKVHRVDEIEDVADLHQVKQRGAPGGGGTSFIPVFEWIAKSDIEYDVLVYLTDMYGKFPPKQPSYPVIWGATTDATHSWGDIVRVEI